MSFESVLSQFEQEDAQVHHADLGKSALIAHNVLPDRHAANRDEARKAGIPVALATPATEKPNAQKLAGLIDDFHQLARTSPKTSQFMADPENAKLAHDDHKPLASLERLWSGDVAQTVGSMVASPVRQFVEGVKGIGSLVTGHSLEEATATTQQGSGFAPPTTRQAMSLTPPQASAPVATGGPLTKAARTMTDQFATAGHQFPELGKLARRLPYDIAGGVVKGVEGTASILIGDQRSPALKGLHALSNAFGYMATGIDQENPQQQPPDEAIAVGENFAKEHPVLKAIMGAGEGLATVTGQVVASGGKSIPLGLLAGGAKLAELKAKLKAENPKMTDKEAEDKALPSAIVDGALFGFMPGMGKVGRAGIDAALAKIGVKELGPVKKAIKDIASTIAVDAPYMVGQRAATAAVERETGADPKADPMQALSGENLLVSGGVATLFAMLHAKGQFDAAKKALADKGVDIKDVTDPQDIHDVLITTGYTPDEISKMFPQKEFQDITGKAVKPEDSEKVAETARNAAHIESILGTSKSSKLAGRDPEVFKAFTKSAAKDAPPVKMDVDKFDAMLAEKGLKPEDVFDDPTAYYEAKFTGDKVHIPASDLAAMAEHVTPDHVKDMSIGEAESVNEVEARIETEKVADAEEGIASAKDDEATSVGTGELLDEFTPDPEQTLNLGALGNERGAVDLTGAVESAARWDDFTTLTPIPRLSRSGASDAAVQHASARIAMPHMVDDLLSKVFPDSYRDPEAMGRTIDVLNKDNILGGYDEFIRRRDDAAKRGEAREAKRWQKAADAVANKHDIAAYERQVRAAMEDPVISDHIKNWKQHVVPALDQLYNEVKRVDPATQRESRGRYLDARINLLPEDTAKQWIEAMGDESKPMPEPSASGYRNPNVKHDRYDRAAKFTGEYSTDARAVLANVLGPRWNEVTKIRFFDDLVNKGLAVEVAPGKASPMEGYKVMPVKMPETNAEGATRQVERQMFVRGDLVDEVRTVLNTDRPLEPNPVAKILTGVQLAQVADAVTHTKNIMTVVTKAQGAGTVWKDITRKMPIFGTVDAIVRIVKVTKEVAGDSPAIRAEIADMAKKGLIRPDFPLTGIQKITRGQQFIHAADTGARIVMNRFFDNLVARGRAEGTEANRRSFVNQVGQYNQRLMGPLMKAAAQSGLSPFIVAGRNFNRQGRWAVSGNPGVRATSLNAAMQLRATNLLGTAALFTVPMMLNALTTGKPGGRSGTPLGAWDLGTDENDGKHKVVDLLQITGLRRGLKSVGVNAFIEGLRTGETIPQIMNNALQDATQTVIHPWLGPAMGFASKTITGRQLDIRGHMDAQKIPGQGPFGPAQLMENFRAALESQNPLVYSMARPALKAAGIDHKPDPPSVAADFLQSQFGETGRAVGEVAATLGKSPSGAFGLKDVQKAKTPAEELTNQFLAQDTGMEPEKQEHYQAKREAVAFLRSGGSWSDMPPKLEKKLADLTPGQLREIDSESQMSDLQVKFKRLEAPKAVEVWRLANDDERGDLRDLYETKINKYILSHDLTDEEQNKLNERIEAAEARK